MSSIDSCSLVVSLEVKPWYSEPKEYVINKGTLSYMDSYTMKYLDKNELFEAIKEDLTNKVNKDSIADFGLVPIEINLSKSGIFIRKPDKDIKALFNYMDVGDKVYSLNDLILSGMIKGGLRALYLCDKKRSEDPTYHVIFKGSLRYVAERIEIDIVDESDYISVLNELKKMKRHSELIRFLLIFLQIKLEEHDFDDIYSMYMNDVSDEEYHTFSSFTSSISEKEEESGYYYRYPYKD